MAKRPTRKTSATVSKSESGKIESVSDNLKTIGEKLSSKETLNRESTSAKEAYQEFQRQADAYRRKQWGSGAGNVQTFPPQYHLHNQHYGHSPHHHYASAPTGMPVPQATQEGSQELLHKVGGMVRLGIDFINAGLAGGLSLMNGFSGQQACHPPHHEPHHGHGSHHDPHYYHHDDCGPHGDSFCNCSNEYDHHDCCCHPQVRGC